MNESEPHAPDPMELSKKRSRTISNLTEEQIRHKRDVDRRAQRASRQRTKDCIARLEQQYLQLQETSRETEAQLRQEIQALHAQNQSLLRCLDSIVDLASTVTREHSSGSVVNDGAENRTSNSPFHGSEHHSNVAQLQESHLELPSPLEGNIQAANLPSSGDAIMSTSPGPTHHSEPGAIHIDTQGDLQNVAALTPSSTPGSDVHMQPEPREPSHGLSGSYPVPVSNSLEAFYPEIDETGPINPIRSQPGLSENLQPLEPIVDGEHSAPIDQGLAIPTPRSATTANSQSYSGRSKSVYAVLPTHLLPTCPLDEILLDFLSSHKDMLSKGVALETVVGPEKPTAKAFLNPELSSSVHSISRVLSEVLLTFPYVHQPEKLAFFYVMHKTMRWQISSTRENYLAMPPWLRPTVTQITVPHAAWIDNIPWPGVRDILIENPDEYPFELFSKYYSQNVTVNWPFDNLDTIADVNGEALLHSIFEKHIYSLKNWTVSSEFQAHFPSMTPEIYPRN